MVNAEKHKRITNIGGMLPIEDKERMKELVREMIDYANNHSKTLLDYLNDFNSELNHYYNTLSGDNGGFLKIGACQRILELYENVLFIKYTIQYNYHVLTIDGSVIKTILQECDNVLNNFKDIQIRQNKNIDNKAYGGLLTVVLSETVFDDYDDYPMENFESIIRLDEPLSLNLNNSC